MVTKTEIEYIKKFHKDRIREFSQTEWGKIFLNYPEK